MKAVFAEEYPQIFTLGLTAAGRALAALERLIFWFIGLSVVGTIFYLPDYIGYYRAREPAPGMLFLVIVAGAFLLSLAAAILRYFRRESWSIDLDERALIYQSARLLRLGAVQQAAIDLAEVERFLLETHPAPRDSRLLAQLRDGGGQRLLVTRFGDESLVKTCDALQAFISRKGLNIPLERPQA